MIGSLVVNVSAADDLPFVQTASPDVRPVLRSAIDECRLEDQHVLLAQGQFTDALYLVADGTLEMRAGEDSWLVTTGDMVGETSALSRFPSAFDVRSVGRSRCWRIRAHGLRALMDAPTAPEAHAFVELFEARYKARALAAVLHQHGIFRSVPNQELAAVRERADVVTIKPGRALAKEGAPIDGLIVVRAGSVRVVAEAGGAPLVVGYMRPGDVAGELPQTLGEAWPYSLTALEHAEVVKIPLDAVETLRRSAAGLDAALMASATQRLKDRGRALRQPDAVARLAPAMDAGLLHGESVLLIDLNLCTRCDDCVTACADTHGGVPRFVREGNRFEQFSVPAACFHCTDPVCLSGCPTGAISRPGGTREVTVNDQTCIGCGTCAKRCPWDNIHTVAFDSPSLGRRIDLAVKCDLCVGRAAGPACVQMCPHGAAFRVNGKSPDLAPLLGEAS